MHQILGILDRRILSQEMKEIAIVIFCHIEYARPWVALLEPNNFSDLSVSR